MRTNTAAARARTLLRLPEGPVALATLLALAAAGQVVVRQPSSTNLPAALLLALGTTAPVAVLRGRTLAAAVTVTAASALSLAPFHTFTAGGLLSLTLCLYVLARRGPRPAAALLPLPFVAYAVATPADATLSTRLGTVLVAAVAGAAAGAGLARRAQDAALAHRSTERAIADTLLENAARGERARIARELHDVVAHHISMIAVQAETGRLATRDLPPDGAKRFLAIGDTARTALTEMRRLLGVLREDAADDPGRRPQPGLAELNELVDTARDTTGAGARLIVRGPVRALDPGVELTAYRIVQEALSNVRRHAPGAAVDVELHYSEADLRVRVRDNGPSPPGPTQDGSHGLLGMRERATTVGGTLRTGPARDGGFLVEAVLPSPPVTASAQEQRP
ncbi:sensor histidine kinase [Streptomyces alboflavus]|uniref:sensor histidine kinase n=1 Tax=Streptomyces alboflavus TaxID=67267 RepID=UPI00369057C9